jgi:hypothetical protein
METLFRWFYSYPLFPFTGTIFIIIIIIIIIVIILIVIIAITIIIINNVITIIIIIFTYSGGSIPTICSLLQVLLSTFSWLSLS